MSIEAFRQAISLFASPQIYRIEAEKQETYERGYVELRCLIDIDAPTLEAIIRCVAAQSPHEDYVMPGHLAYLLKNKWLVEGSPEQYRVGMEAQYPSKCEFGCLKKFLALIEVEKTK